MVTNSRHIGYPSIRPSLLYPPGKERQEEGKIDPRSLARGIISVDPARTCLEFTLKIDNRQSEGGDHKERSHSHDCKNGTSANLQ